ncbi:MAG: alpha/beta hydrolase fold domain-containing protein [Streptomycetaceae bacterium]|nr:alpha/beta hydrolase fold domain-containing protein [Streptomycetaceae bacterium]
MGTSRDAVSIPVTGWALLGLLSSGREMSGYDLKKWADHSLRFFHLSPALSQVYAELRRLESSGYVRHRVAPVANDDLRNKRLYTLTDAGRDAVTAWLREADVEAGVLKHPVILRIWLGHLAGPDRVAQLIDSHQAATRALVDEIRSSRAAAPSGPENAYASAILVWAERHYTGELAAFEELRATLSELAPEERPMPEPALSQPTLSEPTATEPTATEPTATGPTVPEPAEPLLSDTPLPRPLAPEAVPLVAALEAAFPAFGTIPHEEGRARLSAAARARKPAELPAATEDLRIPGPAGDLPARLYRPDTDGPHPVIVYFHGGGFCLGDLDLYDHSCASLAAGTGAAVVSVDYRLAPEHPFPAAVDDTYAATAWVAAHGRDLGLDTARLAVAGDSAGGNLAAVTAIQARDRGGPEIAYQLLIFPGTDLAAETASKAAYGNGGYYMRKETADWFHTSYLRTPADAFDPLASPLRTPDLRGLPPVHLLVGECDALVDECVAYGQRLADAGVPTDVRVYPGMFHGFLNMPLEAARQAREAAYQAVRAALGT